MTHPQFDLRHTIPGEPEVDYPVYGEVPNTNFKCAGKHEGESNKNPLTIYKNF